MTFSWRRVYGIILRLWYGTLRSFDRLTDAFYWVTLDLALWGITARYLENATTGVQNIFFMIVASVILWSVVYRGSVDLAISMLDELWNKNLINLFAAPISIVEWLAACALYGFLKAIVATLFGSLVAFVFYSFNVFTLSWNIIPLFLLLYLAGWTLGIFMTGVIMLYTTKVQALAWTAIWLLAPFSAIYFPLESLPVWAQFIGKCLPTSYVFEQMRSVINGHQLSWSELGAATGISVVLMLAAMLFIKECFRRSLDRGLAKIY